MPLVEGGLERAERRRITSTFACTLRADQAEPHGSSRGHHDAGGHSDRVPLPPAEQMLTWIPCRIFFPLAEI
jgi:hypothetical protein